MKIGIIGSGHIGGLIGTLWSRAGHDVLFSSRHPETLDDLVASLGGSARRGTPDAAIAHGDVLLLSIPFGALPEFGQAKRDALAGKVVLETGNPNLRRDGGMAADVLQSGRGTGACLREWFPGVRMVRAFSTVWDGTLATGAHRVGPHIGIPLASDDADALDVASRLVLDAGFDPVPVGGLDQALRFDVGTAVYDTGMSGDEVRATLNPKPADVV
ncbi:NAD(P)-binding domain-containing protein [Aurantimonas sp. MSK8Z-1]|uniref:NADPH-dependent F420 reductase n=1 Tax=Mangrovibrevibacter kandeliae TaxID=2968473 RepID=UPI002117D070|nr:NAD(P)-binding domain-containing protein [Aurantimonas sp. MSK8Z-1]MCW4115494.1 NAD(P)-binding domain-containing protein [Aurantimonas sp. MSK8Z-1]